MDRLTRKGYARLKRLSGDLLPPPPIRGEFVTDPAAVPPPDVVKRIRSPLANPHFAQLWLRRVPRERKNHD